MLVTRHVCQDVFQFSYFYIDSLKAALKIDCAESPKIDCARRWYKTDCDLFSVSIISLEY